MFYSVVVALFVAKNMVLLLLHLHTKTNGNLSCLLGLHAVHAHVYRRIIAIVQWVYIIINELNGFSQCTLRGDKIWFFSILLCCFVLYLTPYLPPFLSLSFSIFVRGVSCDWKFLCRPSCSGWLCVRFFLPFSLVSFSCKMCCSINPKGI